jgi:hypothetical protein
MTLGLLSFFLPLINFVFIITRFPELYASLRHKGAHIILIPAAFTVKTGAAHWKTLLVVRFFFFFLLFRFRFFVFFWINFVFYRPVQSKLKYVTRYFIF